MIIKKVEKTAAIYDRDVVLEVLFIAFMETEDGIRFYPIDYSSEEECVISWGDIQGRNGSCVIVNDVISLDHIRRKMDLDGFEDEMRAIIRFRRAGLKVTRLTLRHQIALLYRDISEMFK